MRKKIVILGAGYAGVLISKKLAKLLKENPDTELILIDKNPYHTMLTELHEVAAGRIGEENIRISLNKIFAGRKVTLLQDNITAIDFENKRLAGKKESYAYDFLVLATGSKPAFFGIPGAEEHGFPLWSYKDAVRLNRHIQGQFYQYFLHADQNDHNAKLTFFIVGAGLTGVEMAGELAEYRDVLCRQFDLSPGNVNILLVDLMDRIIPSLPERVTDKISARLNKMGVDILVNTKVTSVGKSFIELEQKDQTAPIRYDTNTVIWTAGIQGSTLIENSANLIKSSRGRVAVDPYLRSEQYPNVYIAGDNLYYIPEGQDQPVPQMVENCEGCAKIIAHNIAGEIHGSSELKPYAPKFHGTMVCVGGQWGAAFVGTDQKKFALPSFFAMFVKHFVNILYFGQILGYHKISSYLVHEFFTIRNRRSFVGGHFTNATPSFMLAPLRIFLGIYWVYEGYKKILEGWLRHPMLTGFFQGANDFYERLLNPAAVTASATTTVTPDVVTSATETAAEVLNPVLINFNFPGLFRVLLVNSGEIAFRIQIPLVDSMIDKLILPYPQAQLFFQYVIVLSEILIGLALIAGLFTFLAAAYSLLLQLLFVTSTGLYMATWWMVFAAIAVLFRGGSTLGLDYWVMPQLKKRWKNIGFIKKGYLYND